MERTKKNFNNLAQRLMYSYISLTPAFKSFQSESVSEISQKQMYDFIMDFYMAVYNDPSIIGLEITPDETDDMPMNGRNYLDVRRSRRELRDEVENILNNLRLIGQLGNIENNALKLNKNHLNVKRKNYNRFLSSLHNIGLCITDEGDTLTFRSEKYPDLLDGWKLLSLISEEKYLHCLTKYRHDLYHVSENNLKKIYEDSKKHIFRRVIFDINYDYYTDIIKSLIQDKDSYDRLIEYLSTHDYKRNVIFNDDFSQIIIKYKKEYYDKKGNPYITPEFIIYFQRRCYSPLKFRFVANRNVFKNILPRFEELDISLQDLFAECVKRCDACGFCNQMNRKRPLAFIPVVYKNELVRFCSYFQNIEKTSLHNHIVDDAIDLYEFIDRNYK